MKKQAPSPTFLGLLLLLGAVAYFGINAARATSQRVESFSQQQERWSADTTGTVPLPR